MENESIRMRAAEPKERMIRNMSRTKLGILLRRAGIAQTMSQAGDMADDLLQAAREQDVTVMVEHWV